MEANSYNADKKMLFNQCLKILKNILEGKLEREFKEVTHDFDIDFFDDDANFYSKHINDMCKAIYPMKPLKLLNYEINQRNLLLLLNYIEQLSQYKENIYKEPLIKLNLSLIIGFFTIRYGKKFINTQEYFYLCLKELEKYYGVNNNINETIFDIKWTNKAKKALSKFEEIKKENISIILSQVKIIYKNDYVELEKINKLYL